MEDVDTSLQLGERFPRYFGFPQLSVLTVWVLAQSKALPKPPVVQGHASTDKQLPQDQVFTRLVPETSRVAGPLLFGATAGTARCHSIY
jgi:hypothetical protein